MKVTVKQYNDEGRLIGVNEHQLNLGVIDGVKAIGRGIGKVVSGVGHGASAAGGRVVRVVRTVRRKKPVASPEPAPVSA